MKKNSTKRALLMSALSLVLCLSMLIGTTFAWFTDSVTSGKNIIKAGNLDVELYYMNDETGDAWTKVTADTNVFKEDTLWEPGHTEVIKLKVVNEGTLALKYQLGINVASEVTGTNMDGDTFRLSDYIKFGIADGAQDFTRDTAIAAVKDNATNLNVAYNSGIETLLPEKEKIVTMVVYMPSSVGNEANYRGNKIPTINLGISLYATQFTYEDDSFNNQYDKDAAYSQITYYVNNPEEFTQLLNELSAATDITSAQIVLNTDVSWETGAAHGSTPLISETSSVKELYITGNGNTLTATGKGVGPIRMANGGKMSFNGVRFVDESVSYAEGSWEFGYLEFAGDLAFVNCDFVNAIMISGEYASFKSCSFNSYNSNEYAVWVDNGDASFFDCFFAGARGLKIHEAYGSEVGSVTVIDSTFSNLSKKPGIAIGDLNADTTVSITGSKFVNCQPGDQGMFIYESDTAVSAFAFVEENNTVTTDVPSAVITGGFETPDGTQIAKKIRNVVFGKPSDYSDIVANNQPISDENGVDVYQIAVEGGLYDVYYLSEAKIVMPEVCRNLFAEMSAMTQFDATNLDMSQVTDALCMFLNCSKLTTIKGVEDWDMSNVTNMQSIFYGCNKLEDIDVSKWNTSNVTNMRMVFFRCYALDNDSLKGVENWDVSNVSNFYSMFKHARGLTSLDLSKWDTSSATNMSHMFANIGGVEILDLSSFDTSKVTDMSWMFYDASKLTTIYVGDGWTTAALDPAKPTCFYNNQALVGGNGTTWLDVCDMANANRPWESSAKLIYAIADGTNDQPGLFTYKAN